MEHYWILLLPALASVVLIIAAVAYRATRPPEL